MYIYVYICIYIYICAHIYTEVLAQAPQRDVHLVPLKSEPPTPTGAPDSQFR